MPEEQPQQEQPQQFSGQVIITLPQAYAPLAVPLSATRSIDLHDVSCFEVITWEKEEKGKTVSYDAPALFLKSRREPMELTAAEIEVFKTYWNILLRNTQNQFQLIQQFLPPAAPPAETKQLEA